jgi:hypothetical protein
MSKNSTATDVLEVIESPDLGELVDLDEGSGHRVIKGLLIMVGVAVIAAAVAAIVSRRDA